MSERKIDSYFKILTSQEVSSHNHEVVTSSDARARPESANFPNGEVTHLDSKQRIGNMLQKQSSITTAKNQQLLHLSINTVKLLAFEGLAFQGFHHDPLNRGNFLEIVNHVASYNEELAFLLEDAAQNATYTSPDAQKEILSIYASKIRRFIRDEIGNEKFCVIVDVFQDEYYRDQMAIILRFVDKLGLIRERFFDLVHMDDTESSTLKKKICDILSSQNLNISDIRGYGYDAASRRVEELHDLQALLLEECGYAHYIHSFAHSLELILVAKSQSVTSNYRFFDHLSLLISVVTDSCKRDCQLQIVQAIQIIESTTTVYEFEIGKEKDQVGTLQRSCDMKWGSHLKSLQNVLRLFDSILSILSEVINDENPKLPRVSAYRIYDVMVSFEFVFIMHFMIELLGRTDNLCRVLYCKSQDVVNAIDAALSTQEDILNLRENGWNELFETVKDFCTAQDIEVPDMNGLCKINTGRIKKEPTWEYHYHIEIFNGTIDCMLQELKYRFSGHNGELLKLSSALDPRDGYKLFDIGVICKLVEKLYPADFTDHEKLTLKYQLELFQVDIQRSVVLNVSTLSDLCKVLSETGKSFNYNLIDRLIRLILTLPSTYERSFSIMGTVRSRLENEVEAEFLPGSLLMNIEQEIVQSFDDDAIIDEFNSRSQCK